MGGRIMLEQGTDLDRPRQVKNPLTGAAYDGLTVATTSPFLGSDTLSVNVWPGGSQAVTFNPTAIWLDPTGAATYQLTIGASQTATLAAGRYEGATYLSRNGLRSKIDGFELVLTQAAGTDTLRPVYCQLTDMLKFAPWLQNVQAREDLTGFADQRADAREWYENIVLRCYRGGGWGNYNEHSAAAFAFAGGGPRKQIGKSIWLTQQLAANKLMVLPEVVKVNALYAIYMVCNAQIARKDNPYDAFAARYYAQAQTLVCNSTAQLDITGNGFYAVAIPLGSTNPLFT